MKKIIYIFCFYILNFNSFLPQKIDNFFWVSGNDIYVLHQNADSLIIGGNFTTLERPKARIAEISYPQGKANLYYPSIYNNQVNTLAYNSNGDLYIGGSFTQLIDTSNIIYNINRIAKITNSGLIDTTFLSWGANSSIRKLAIKDNYLYIAGDFTVINGINRNYLARFDLNNNTLDSWDLNVNGSVYDLLFDGDTLYIVGGFTSVLGAARNRAAKVILPNILTSWAPNLSGTVSTISFYGNTIYLGGSFTTINGITVNRLGGVNRTYGNLVWSLSNGANSTVNKLLVYPDNDSLYLFVGGAFTSISGIARNYLASVNLITNTVTTWNPSPNSAINTFQIAPSSNTILIGGGFTMYNSQSIRFICEINPPSSNYTLRNFAPEPTGSVYSIEFYDNQRLAIGGAFTGINRVYRNRLAAINLNNGEVTNWNPNCNGAVWSIAIYNNNELFIGGAFTTVGGQTRNRFAAFNINNGELNNRIYGVSGTVYSMIVLQDELFIGGAFTTITIGSINYTRNRIASINLLTNNPTLFNPGLNQELRVMLIEGDYLYLGGRFTNIGGITRNRIARINLTTRDLDSWNPNVGGLQFSGGTAIYVYGITIGASRVYFCGDFTQVSGTTRRGIAAVDVNTGALIADWNPDLNNIGYDIKFFDNIIFVGGTFTQIAGSSYNRIGAIDALIGNVIASFNPNANNTVRYLLISPSYQKIFVGGSFTSIGGNALLTRLASISMPNVSQQYLTIGFTVSDLALPKNSANQLVYVGLKWLDNSPPEQGVWKVTFSIQSSSILIDTSKITLPAYLQSNFTLNKTPILNGASISITGNNINDLLIDNGFNEAQYNILEIRFNTPDSLGTFSINLINSSSAQIRSVAPPYVLSYENVNNGTTNLNITTYSIFPIFTPYFEAYPFAFRKYGDLNWDGYINIADLTSIADAILENYSSVNVTDPLYGSRKFFEFPVGENPINYDDIFLQDRSDRRCADLFGTSLLDTIKQNGEGDDIIDQMDLAVLLDGLLTGVWPNYAIDAIKNKPAFLKTGSQKTAVEIPKTNFEELTSSIVFEISEKTKNSFMIQALLLANDDIKGVQFLLKNFIENKTIVKVENKIPKDGLNFYHREKDKDLSIIIFGSKNIFEADNNYLLFEIEVKTQSIDENIFYSGEILASCDNFSKKFVNIVVSFNYNHFEIKDYNLSQNFPNPFNSETNVIIDIPERSEVEIELFDIMGKKVFTIYKGELAKSRNTFKVNFERNLSKNLSSGVYIFTLKAKSKESSKKYFKTIKSVYLK